MRNKLKKLRYYFNSPLVRRRIFNRKLLSTPVPDMLKNFLNIPRGIEYATIKLRRYKDVSD